MLAGLEQASIEVTQRVTLDPLEAQQLLLEVSRGPAASLAAGREMEDEPMLQVCDTRERSTRTLRGAYPAAWPSRDRGRELSRPAAHIGCESEGVCGQKLCAPHSGAAESRFIVSW